MIEKLYTFFVLTPKKPYSHLKHLFKSHQRDMLKVLIVTVVVFSALNFFNFQSKKPAKINTNFTSELDKQISQALEFTDQSEQNHAASGANSGDNSHAVPLDYNQLCISFSLICQHTNFNGAFSDNQKMEYFSQIIQIISRLDLIKTQ